MRTFIIGILSIIPLCLQAQNDPVINTPATAKVIAQGLKAEAKAIGVIAYQWGYPLVRMEEVIRTYTTLTAKENKSSYRAPVNTIGWARQLPSPQDTDMPTANNDTYYMSAVLVLNEPYIVSVPDTHDRYYVIDIFDMYHNLVDYIGRRTTGTQKGEFLIVPPQWDGVVPQGITKVIRPKTDKVWLWGRIAISEGEESKTVHQLQDQFSVKILKGTATPLSLWKNHDGDLAFFYNLAQAVKQNKVPEDEKAIIGLFEKIGIKNGTFNPATLHPMQLEGLKEALLEAPLTIVANTATAGESRNGWMWVSDLDNFGYNFGLRALVSGPYLGGQGEKEAMYPIRYVDHENKILTGKNSYTLRFETMPDVDAFWSVTVYDAKTKMLIENPINRYKISSTTPAIKYSKNGGLDITLSHKKPAEKANWLPIPDGDFYLLLRLYQPGEKVLNGSYQLPIILKK